MKVMALLPAPQPRNVLTPEALTMMDAIARSGSFATAAGRELLDEGRHLLEQMDAVASRVKRIATGWESQLGIAMDDVISRSTMLDLCSAFYAECAVQARAARSSGSASAAASAPASGAAPALALAASAPPTRLRLRT